MVCDTSGTCKRALAVHRHHVLAATVDGTLRLLSLPNASSCDAAAEPSTPLSVLWQHMLAEEEAPKPAPKRRPRPAEKPKPAAELQRIVTLIRYNDTPTLLGLLNVVKAANDAIGMNSASAWEAYKESQRDDLDLITGLQVAP